MSECDYYILRQEGDVFDLDSLLSKLRDSVQEFMDNNSGWRPVGGVSMVTLPLDDRAMVAQAMLHCWE